MQRTTAEITEIERHKYYLSEQQGHDVGWEFAEQDWEANYGNAWRQEHLPIDSPSRSNQDVPCTQVTPAGRIMSQPPWEKSEPLSKRTQVDLQIFMQMYMLM